MKKWSSFFHSPFSHTLSVGEGSHGGGNLSATVDEFVGPEFVDFQNRGIAHEAAELDHVARFLSRYGDEAGGSSFVIDHADGCFVSQDGRDGGSRGVAGNGNHVKAYGADTGHGFQFFQAEAAFFYGLNHTQVFAHRNESAGEAAYAGGGHEAAFFHSIIQEGQGGMPALGGIGAGLATMMTYGFLLGLFLLVVMKSKDLGGRQIFASLALRSKDLREYLVVGVPSGLSIFMEMSLFSLIIVFLSRYGTDALAAYQIADNFASLVYMLPVSCSMALTILIATAVGAGDMTLARRYKKAGFVVAMGGAMMTASFTVLFRNSIGSVYTDDAAVALIAGQFLIYSAGWQLFDAISTPIQGILRGLKDTRISFVLMVLAYWGGCFPMSLFLDSHTALGADSFWLGLDFGVGCSAFLMILRLLYVERKLDGRPMPSLSWLLTLIPGRKTAPAAVYAISLQRNIKKAEELLDLWTAMEEKLSMLMQKIKESEVDIYEALGSILPIRLSLLTDLHLSIIGHASRAYIP